MWLRWLRHGYAKFGYDTWLRHVRSRRLRQTRLHHIVTPVTPRLRQIQLRHIVTPRGYATVTPNSVTPHSCATCGYADYAKFGYAT